MKTAAFVLLSLLVPVICCGQAKPANATPAYVDVPGGQLYYEECGSGAAIVLLHDGLLHSAVWDGHTGVDQKTQN